MSNFRLNLPVDIPWTLIDCSRDMMDQTFCDKKFPPPFRSSIAIYAYEPKAEELPTELCGKKITYLKVSCSITGYQPDSDEIEKVAVFLDNFQDVDYSIVEADINTYFGCYGVLLNVGVFPFDDELLEDFDKFPHIIDFEPKIRDFYQAASETGEVLTSSFNKASTTKSFGATDSTENSWKTGANIKVPAEVTGGPEIGLNGETGQVRTEADQENWGINSDASRERHENQSTTTQLSQMYNLLTGYHAGTNRATFIMLPRPHIFQPTNRRTFVQGLRQMEGIQDFFFIVVRHGDENQIRVEVQLETGHFPENIEPIETIAPEDQYETKKEIIGPFTRLCLNLSLTEGTVGTVADSLGGDPPFIRTDVTPGMETFDGFEVDGWEFDMGKGDPGHKPIHEKKLTADTLDDFEGISFIKHVYQRVVPDKVNIEISVKNKNMWPTKAAKFSRQYEVFLRRKKNIESSKVADPNGMLISQRKLCAQMQFGECITSIPITSASDIDYSNPFVDEPSFDLNDFYQIPEPNLGNVDPITPPTFGYTRRKALVRKIQATMRTSANSPFRYKLGTVGFLQTNYLQRRLSKILPKQILEMPVYELDSIDEETRAKIPKQLLIKDLLAISPNTLARRIKGSVSEALKIKSSLFAVKRKN